MKKLLIILLTFCLLFGLFACAKPADQPDNPDQPADPVEPGNASYILDMKKDIRPLGRTYTSGSMFCFDYAGSGFEFSFVGTSVKAKLGATGGGIEVTCFVDGERTKKVALTNTTTEYTLAENLANTAHTVKIVKSAMVCTVATYATEVTVEGKISDVPAAKDRQILALGDSLSVGRAVLGDSTTVSSTPKVNDCTYATPWLIAEHFNADLELIADTGYGIWQSSSGDKDKIIPKVWKTLSYSTRYPYDFKKSSPDIIIINLGTNDVQANPATAPATFMEAMNAFLDDIRAQYPETPILYYYGMMAVCNNNMPLVKRVINQRIEDGDTNLYYLPLENLGSSNLQKLGEPSYSHPIVAHYQYYAPIVEAKIAEIMGW